MMVQELTAIVAIKPQDREGQGLFHVLRGRQHARGNLVPDRPAFSPSAEDIRIREAPNEVPSQTCSAVCHAVSFHITGLFEVPGAGPNGDVRFEQAPRFSSAPPSPGML